MDYSLFAHLYDRFVAFEDDLRFFEEECASAPGRVLELMAGTGRVTAHLVGSGIRPACVDRSPEMLGVLARKLGVAAPPVVCADVRSLPFSDAFVLAILPFTSFSELVSEEARHEALRSIRGALRPGARFVLTLHNPPVRLASVSPEPRQVAEFPHPSGEGRVCMTIESSFDAARGVVTGTQTFTTRIDEETESRVVVPIEFCLPSRAWTERAAAEAGFSIEALFGDYDRSAYSETSSRFMIWRLKA